MKHWNYRVIKYTTGEFMLHEVYYENDGDALPTSISSNAAVVIGDDIDEMKRVIEKMKEALDKPVLDLKDTI
jgi:hypothetical protein